MFFVQAATSLESKKVAVIQMRWTTFPLLVQDLCGELCLAIRHVVGSGGPQFCSAAEAPADTSAFETGVVSDQGIDIRIAQIGGANPASLIFIPQSIYAFTPLSKTVS